MTETTDATGGDRPAGRDVLRPDTGPRPPTPPDEGGGRHPRRWWMGPTALIVALALVAALVAVVGWGAA
ncbi:MAG TPA: hypothetical protein VFI47_14895, partial [Acidimicrobiales bacterium]|nr:hypothetical protein [Acidimicrobiales bacterium]